MIEELSEIAGWENIGNKKRLTQDIELYRQKIENLKKEKEKKKKKLALVIAVVVMAIYACINSAV